MGIVVKDIGRGVGYGHQKGNSTSKESYFHNYIL